MPAGFDPDGPGEGEGLFGLPPEPDRAAVHVLAVPWDATASYGRGSRRAPPAVLAASQQVDLHDLEYGDAWEEGVVLVEDPRIAAWADEAEPHAAAVHAGGGGAEAAAHAAAVDAIADRIADVVEEFASARLRDGRIPAVLGGEHSVVHGLVRAAARARPGLGILQVDAHADLRPAYLGFRTSHASAMHRALELPGVSRLVGVGWRDVGRGEMERVERESGRIVAFPDPEIAEALAAGIPWGTVVNRIVDALPDEVHVSVDIDGLDPSLCPHTGTPVPGGLSFRDLCVLLRRVSEERRVVSFDLVEVCPAPGPARGPADEFDALVGARVLYKLFGCAVRSASRG